MAASNYIYEYLYGVPIIWTWWSAELLRILVVILAALVLGYIYANKEKRRPDKRDIKRFALATVFVAVSFLFIHRALLAYVGAPVFEDPAASAWVEKELGITAPKALTVGVLIFLPFYYLFYYWLVGLSFAKGASLFNTYLEKKNAQKGV